MARKKVAVAKPKPVDGEGRWAAASLPSRSQERAGALVRALLCLCASFVLVCYVLPYLAELTPPGVDLSATPAQDPATHRTSKSFPAEAIPKGCETSCDNLHCPDGWFVDRSPDDPCKCICVRSDPAQMTLWDLQQRASKAEREGKDAS